MICELSVKHYKVTTLPTCLQPNSIYFVYPGTGTITMYVTDINGNAILVGTASQGGGNVNSVTGTGVTGTASDPIINILTFLSNQAGNMLSISTADGKLFIRPITSPNNTLTVTQTATEIQLDIAEDIMATLDAMNFINVVHTVTLEDMGVESIEEIDNERVMLAFNELLADRLPNENHLLKVIETPLWNFIVGANWGSIGVTDQETFTEWFATQHQDFTITNFQLKVDGTLKAVIETTENLLRMTGISITELILVNIPSVVEIDVSSNLIQYVELGAFPPNCATARFAGNPLTLLDTEFPASLITLDLRNCSFSEIDGSVFPNNILNIIFSNEEDYPEGMFNTITSDSLNQFLALKVSEAVTGKAYRFENVIDVVGNQPPTGQGLLDKATLISAGNTIITE